MSDGSGCDGGGHGCGGSHGSSAGGGGDSGYAIGADGHSPAPNIKRVTVNGAPVTAASHEFVMSGYPAPEAIRLDEVAPSPSGETGKTRLTRCWPTLPATGGLC